MGATNQLRREISLPGAIMLGLGAIVGTGVFVSMGVAMQVTGPSVLLAILLAGLVAVCNGLSSAQLAAAHPVSGGTYEYGYRWLSPELGAIAGWLFLSAKSASAATAVLGLATYLDFTIGIQAKLGLDTETFLPAYLFQVGVALLILAMMVAVVVVGIKRTTLANSIIVAITLSALMALVVCGLPTAIENVRAGRGIWFGMEDVGKHGQESSYSWSTLFNATALMFVAFTGYGRIATMGEEVKQPRRTIPIAMIATLATTIVLYLSVGFVLVGVAGPELLQQPDAKGVGVGEGWAAPLLQVSAGLKTPWLTTVVEMGGITAMLGVVLNLLLGLSRVVLAMSRRTDLPEVFSKVNSHGVPLPATLLVACIVGGLVCLGDVKVAWSFSAFTVLVYYAITNFCAIRMPADERIYPVWIAWIGLASCLSLAAFIPWQILLAGLMVIVAGFTAATIRKSQHCVKK
ncbi:MAG: APA family basic amino acid/polyamine antiporter [Mariniblastus sp.]|jgi:APA family basic amino acid/polyamine antiporter